MKVLITSKTRKGNAACVGGLCVENRQFVRLLNPGNWDQYSDTRFDIGDIWDIDFTDRDDVTPPHIEDVIVLTSRYLYKVDDIRSFILNSGVTVWHGDIDEIFDGKIRWTNNGSGYIGDSSNLPNNSVGFWISNCNLHLNSKGTHYNHSNGYGRLRQFKYTGFSSTINFIPCGTLIRFSLARWWKPADSDMQQNRCYLQLSGWY